MQAEFEPPTWEEIESEFGEEPGKVDPPKVVKVEWQPVRCGWWVVKWALKFGLMVTLMSPFVALAFLLIASIVFAPFGWGIFIGIGAIASRMFRLPMPKQDSGWRD